MRRIYLFLLIFCTILPGFAADSEIITDTGFSSNHYFRDYYNRSVSYRDSFLFFDYPYAWAGYSLLLNNQLKTVDGHFINLQGGYPIADFYLYGNMFLGIERTSPLTSEFALENETSFFLDIGFQKRVHENSALTAAVNSVFSDKGLGVYLDLGYSQYFEQLFFLNDVKTNIFLENFGWDNLGNAAYIPDAFSLRLQADTSLLSWEWGSLRTGIELFFPGFTQFRFDISAAAELFDFMEIGTSLAVDTEALSAGNARDLIPDVTLAFSIPLEKAGITGTIGYDLPTAGYAAISAQAGVTLGSIDNEEPQLNTDIPAQLFLSPNEDNVNELLAVTVELEDKQRIINGRLLIRNENDTPVYTLDNTFYTNHANAFKNIFTDQSGRTLTLNLKWDGKNEDGIFVSDGLYTLQVQATDQNGNQLDRELSKIIVDSSFPSAEISQNTKIISPNNDGHQDSITFLVQATTENEWTAEISDEDGEIIYSEIFYNIDKFEVNWDGMLNSEVQAEDGTYYFTVSATDPAGNAYTSSPKSLLLDTGVETVQVQNSRAYISPNGDGVKDDLFFTVNATKQSTIVSYVVNVINAAGKTFYSDEKDGAPAKTFRIPHESLDDGQYRLTLTVVYPNGSRPQASSNQFTIDTTPPSAQIKADKKIFSPNSDGVDDVITIYQETSPEQEWNGTLTDAEGFLIDSFVWTNYADPALVWDGYGKFGFPLQDGMYQYFIESEDESGNKGRSETITFELTTAGTEIVLLTDSDSFSPNQDQVKDSIKITPRIQKQRSIQNYTFSILNDTSTEVYYQTGASKLPSSFIWHGTDQSGLRVKDGTYQARLNIAYFGNETIESFSRKFAVDTKPPEINISVQNPLFSPNYDGKNDSLVINQTSSNENLWTAQILDESGNVLKTFIWNGSVTDISWNGTDANGNIVPDGIYSYKIFTSDSAGNSVSTTVHPLTVDTLQIEGEVVSSFESYSPVADGSLPFELYLNYKTGIESWNFTIFSADNKVLKEYSGTDSLPKQINWNGQTTASFKEGSIYGRFTAEFARGDSINLTSAPIYFDSVAPELDIQISPPVINAVASSLYAAIITADENVGVSFSSRNLTITPDSIEVKQGTNRLELEIANNLQNTDVPQPVVLNITAEDSAGNVNTYKIMLVLDIYIEQYGNSMICSMLGIDDANWSDINIDPVQFAAERLAYYLDSNKPSQILISLPEGWVLYTISETAAYPEYSTSSGSVIAALTELGYDRDRFRSLTLGEAAVLSEEIKGTE